MSDRSPAQHSEAQPTGASPAVEAHQPDSAEDWHRLHPLSPLIRGWIVVLATIDQQLLQTFFGFTGH